MPPSMRMSAVLKAGVACSVEGWMPSLSNSIRGKSDCSPVLPVGIGALDIRSPGELPGSWDCQRREGFCGAWPADEPFRECCELVREGALEDDMVGPVLSMSLALVALEPPVPCKDRIAFY